MGVSAIMIVAMVVMMGMGMNHGMMGMNQVQESGTTESAGSAAESIFKSKCKGCHALDHRKFGPAFRDMNRDQQVIISVITNGRRAMPAFGKSLSEMQIKAMAEFIARQQGERAPSAK